ncbi:MAG: ATPase, T2SS/T4P/T4SS family [bacterium]
MNYASKILTYLGGDNRFSQVLLVAGAPPVEKKGTEFHIVINTVLTPDDIRDTLATLASHARRSGPTDMGKHGVFAFGMPNLGRFRVHYLTQRGSDFVAIQRMTYDIPKLETLLSSPEQMTLMESSLNQPDGGIVLFTGPSSDALSQLLYASLARLNATQNKIIYILEQSLSYLLRHRNSVVIQVEVGTDIPTLSEGIQNSLCLAPDLVYIRDPKTPGEYASLMCAAEAGALVLISIVSFNEQHMMNDLKARIPDDFPTLNRLIRKTIKVSTDPSGTIRLGEFSGS